MTTLLTWVHAMAVKHLLSLLTLWMLTATLCAQSPHQKPTAPPTTKPQGQPQKQPWFNLSLTAFALSQKLFRGAVFYPYPVIFAGPAITLFGHLSLRGPHIAWVYGKRRSPQKMTIGARWISDGAPLLTLHNKFDQRRDYRASRTDSLELYGNYAYRFGVRNLFSIGSEWAQELAHHRGQYLAVYLGLPLYKFLSLTLRTGLGSSAHNRYLYGPEGRAGLAHQDASVRYVIPRLPWQGLIMLELSWHWVLQSANQTAHLVRGNDHVSKVSTRWLWFF